MEQTEIDKLEEFIESKRVESRYQFKEYMIKGEKGRLQSLQLNPSEDIPVPDWVLRVINQSWISKRTKLYLILFHNENIRKERMKRFTGVSNA